MRIDNGTGANGIPPISPNTTLAEGPLPPNGEMAPNAAPNPIAAHIPSLNDINQHTANNINQQVQDIDKQIQAIQTIIQNYNETHQHTLINQIQALPEAQIERLTDIFLNAQEELPLEVLHAFVSRLASPDKQVWDDLLKNTFSKPWLKISEDKNNYTLNETATNILNMYLVLFKIKDVDSLEISDSLHDFLDTRPQDTYYSLMNHNNILHDTYYDLLNCVLHQIITSKITAIQEKFPSCNTKSSRNT